MKRIVKITVLVLVLMLVTATAGILALWHNEQASVASFKKIRARNDAHMDGSVYDMHDSAGTSYHYMVADASGRSAIFEWVAGTDATDTDGSARQLVITYNDQDAQIGENEGSSDAQWVTNFVIQPGYYDNEENQKGLDRYRHIEGQLMAAGGVLADERATMDALASVGRRSWNNNSGEHLTIHSAVYNLTDKTVVWVPNENYNDPEAWFTFAL